MALLPGSSSARLSMDVTVGFDNAVMPQSWAPVMVELFNDGPPVEGLIEVSPGSIGRGIRYCKPVVLPTNSRKRLWIYAHVGNHESSFDVKLLAPNGRVIDQGTVGFRTLPPQAEIFATATRSDLHLLPPGAKPDPQREIHGARLRQVAVPDDAVGYEGLKALVLTDIAESEWTPAQRSALRNWVALGGHLVVSVNNADNFIKSRYWGEFLPMQITSSEVAPSLKAIESVAGGSPTLGTNAAPVAVGEVIAGTIRVRAGEFPLIVERPYGRGTVTLLTFSVETEPFRSWSNKEAFWAGLIGVPVAPAVESQDKRAGRFGQPQAYWGMRTFDDIFRVILESRLERQISLWWLLLLIGCYLVVIGPFDYWFVRHRLKRPVLTWLTFPCYVVGFSGLIYGIGYSLKSGDSELVQASFVDVVPEANLSRGTTIAGFYSTSNRRFPFVGATAESHFRFTSSGFENPAGRGGAVLSGETQVIETDKGFQASVPVPIWSSKMFVSDWTRSGGLLQVQLSTEAGPPKVQIANRSGTTLRGVTIISGNGVHSLGDLKANASLEAEIDGKSGRQDFASWLDGLTDPKLMQILQYWGWGGRHYGQREVPAWETVLPLLTFAERIRQLPEHAKIQNWREIDLSKYVDQPTIIVLAYADKFSGEGLEPKFRPDRAEHHALLRCVVRRDQQRTPN